MRARIAVNAESPCLDLTSTGRVDFSEDGSTLGLGPLRLTSYQERETDTMERETGTSAHGDWDELSCRRDILRSNNDDIVFSVMRRG